ncbi:response regulator [Limisalsivibrio acetivorans]|uniref:response regulator n=1 Tax=Limisalsivibrio acetivorans TaxID=1304888 RepID=UPI0003B735CC|nr:response regulator [Limisalsivibrio acetivorans]
MENNFTVFIVDDNLPTRKLLSATMRNEIEGTVIHEFENGLDCVNACRECKPDMVLMDYRMPGLDGIEATRIVKKVYPAAEVIAFTGVSESGLDEKFAEAGASEVIKKPLNADKRLIIMDIYNNIISARMTTEEEIAEEEFDDLDSIFDFDLEDGSTSNINETDSAFLDHTHVDKIPASEYLQRIGDSYYELTDALNEHNDELYSTVMAFEKNKSYHIFEEILHILESYSNTLYSLIDFAGLEYAMRSLADFLAERPFADFSDEDLEFICQMLYSVLDDMQEWKKIVFDEQTAQDIHFLDQSLVSSIMLIVDRLKSTENVGVSSDDDLEFF